MKGFLLYFFLTNYRLNDFYDKIHLIQVSNYSWKWFLGNRNDKKNPGKTPGILLFHITPVQVSFMCNFVFQNLVFHLFICFVLLRLKICFLLHLPQHLPAIFDIKLSNCQNYYMFEYILEMGWWLSTWGSLCIPPFKFRSCICIICVSRCY